MIYLLFATPYCAGVNQSEVRPSSITFNLKCNRKLEDF